MKIKLTSVYVDDQKKVSRFYTEVLGLPMKSDPSQGPYRQPTVASPEDPDGTGVAAPRSTTTLRPRSPAGHIPAGPACGHVFFR